MGERTYVSQASATITVTVATALGAKRMTGTFSAELESQPVRGALLAESARMEMQDLTADVVGFLEQLGLQTIVVSEAT